MKQITLHIGFAKTGTSSLQRYITANQQSLADRGICYPVTGRGGHIAHHAMADACRGLSAFSAPLSEMRAELAAEIEPFERVILSSESFQSLQAYPGLVRLFGAPASRWLPFPKRHDRKITTICYAREALDMGCSQYAQRAQATGMSSSLARFCANGLHPLPFVAGFWSWFSDDIEFCYYDRSRLRNQDVIEDFFHRIGVDLPGPPEHADANPSISGNLLGFKLLLNRHRLHDRSLYRTFSEIALQDPAYRGRFCVSDVQAARIRKRASNYNATLTRLVGQISCRSYANGNPVPNVAMWHKDLERFLAHANFAHLKHRQEICRADAQEVDRIMWSEA